MLDEKFLHMRCLAYVINLVVSDGLTDVGDSINWIRWTVRYIRQSPSRLAKFKTCIVIEKLVFTTSLCLDVYARWNSTYLMLAAAQQYEKAFGTFFEEDQTFVQRRTSINFLRRMIGQMLGDCGHCLKNSMN